MSSLSVLRTRDFFSSETFAALIARAESYLGENTGKIDHSAGLLLQKSLATRLPTHKHELEAMIDEVSDDDDDDDDEAKRQVNEEEGRHAPGVRAKPLTCPPSSFKEKVTWN